MNCVRCGKTIPEGEIFCEACASSPLPGMEKTGTIPTVPRTRASKPQKRSGGRAGLIVAVILLTLITGASLWYTYKMYKDVRVQQANLRVQQAEMTQRELALANQQNELEEAETALQQAQQTETALRTQIADLQAQIKGNESSVNQSQYDLETAQKRVEELETSLQTAADTVEDLTAAKETLEKDLDTLQKDYKTLKEKTDKQSEKLDWIDAYVVYVENDGTEYYHTFECERFKRQNFWVYNRKLAESKGYTPCPVCGG